MPQSLVDYLLARFPTAKRQTLKRMVQAGRVTINDVAARTLQQPLAETDRVVVRPQARSVPVIPGKLRIVYEDADILVANKPPGLLTSTAAGEQRTTLIALVRSYLAQSDPRALAGVVHRLDRDAAGLLVFSKNHAAYRHLKEQFFRHSVERIYHAVVQGVPHPATGCIETSLAEWADGSVHSTRRGDTGQRAATKYQVLRHGGGMTLLRVQLLTGRKHQIRAHLSERGWPIVGDRIYGHGRAQDRPAPLANKQGRSFRRGAGPSPARNFAKTPAPRLMLLASKLAFNHPGTNKPVEFNLPLPPDMERMVP